MSDQIKELVKRLREERKLTWKDCEEAASALEAMAGEVERLKSQRDEYLQFWKNNAEACEAAEAERDRLKAALEAFVKHFGPLQDNAMLHEGVRNCYRLARKALGGDA